MSVIEKLDALDGVRVDVEEGADGLWRIAGSHSDIIKLGEVLRELPAIRQAMIDAERFKRDIKELYEVMPMLPITAEAMEAATDWFTRYCIDFYREINAAQVRRQEEGHD